MGCSAWHNPPCHSAQKCWWRFCHLDLPQTASWVLLLLTHQTQHCFVSHALTWTSPGPISIHTAYANHLPLSSLPHNHQCHWQAPHWYQCGRHKKRGSQADLSEPDNAAPWALFVWHSRYGGSCCMSNWLKANTPELFIESPEVPNHSGALLPLPTPKEPLDSAVTPCGALQLCPFPVVPEWYLSCLYASPRAGLRALMRLLKFITESHSADFFLAQENNQEFWVLFQSSAALRCFFLYSLLVTDPQNGHINCHFGLPLADKALRESFK